MLPTRMLMKNISMALPHLLWPLATLNLKIYQSNFYISLSMALSLCPSGTMFLCVKLPLLNNISDWIGVHSNVSLTPAKTLYPNKLTFIGTSSPHVGNLFRGCKSAHNRQGRTKWHLKSPRMTRYCWVYHQKHVLRFKCTVTSFNETLRSSHLYNSFSERY